MNIAGLIKKFIMKRFVSTAQLKRPCVRLCIEHGLLPSLLARTPCDSLRKILNLPASKNQTQLNQDVFALLMNQFRAGWYSQLDA